MYFIVKVKESYYINEKESVRDKEFQSENFTQDWFLTHLKENLQAKYTEQTYI
jgi:hypothetical protein